jgi:hypothetical protein
MSGPCSVYIVGHEHPIFGYAVKVGISESVGSRIAGFQTGNCEDLILFFFATLPDRATAMRAESLFHEMFDDYAIRGEWFAMSPDRATFMVGNIISDLAVPIPSAFEAFHAADYDMRADWVNDWAVRYEEMLEAGRYV